METDRVDLPEQFIDAVSPDAGIAWQACLNSLRVRCDVEVYDAGSWRGDHRVPVLSASQVLIRD